MGIFSFWRHHLANEAHRRYIAEHPTSRERAKAARRAQYDLGVRATRASVWADFVQLWLPYVEEQRDLHRQRYLRELETATTQHDHDYAVKSLERLEQPITWPMLVAAAQSCGMKAIRPPRHIEKALRAGTCCLAGPATTDQSPGTESNSPFAS